MQPNFEDSDITGGIIGCAMRIHTALGSGFMELIYQEALAIELEEVGLVFSREHEMPIRYKGRLLGTRRVDFLVADKISVELKAVSNLENVHLAQAMNYLEVYNLKTGMLINFGSLRLQFHRLTNKKYDPKRDQSELSKIKYPIIPYPKNPINS
jgi:GxxExxY protein